MLWAYSANRYTRPNTTSPASYAPARVDVGGLDTYDPDYRKADAKDRVNLEGYSAIKPRSGRRALTEVGPHGSTRGDWNPATILRTAHASKIRPLWAMLWFDDGTPTGRNPAPGKKQITSLTGGRSFLRSCNDPALCYLE